MLNHSSRVSSTWVCGGGVLAHGCRAGAGGEKWEDEAGRGVAHCDKR